MALRHVVEDRHGHARKQERGHFTGHQRDRQALENRVEQDDRGAYDHRGGGEGHRAEAHRAGVDDGLLEGRPSRNRSSMKSTRMIELRTTMPAPAMKPIIDVAVKNAPIAAPAGRRPARTGLRP